MLLYYIYMYTIIYIITTATGIHNTSYVHIAYSYR